MDQFYTDDYFNTFFLKKTKWCNVIQLVVKTKSVFKTRNIAMIRIIRVAFQSYAEFPKEDNFWEKYICKKNDWKIFWVFIKWLTGTKMFWRGIIPGSSEGYNTTLTVSSIPGKKYHPWWKIMFRGQTSQKINIAFFLLIYNLSVKKQGDTAPSYYWHVM